MKTTNREMTVSVPELLFAMGEIVDLLKKRLSEPVLKGTVDALDKLTDDLQSSTQEIKIELGPQLARTLRKGSDRPEGGAIGTKRVCC